MDLYALGNVESLPQLPVRALPFLVKQRVGGHILRYDAVSGNDGIVADGDALEHHDVGPEPHVVADAHRRGGGRLVSVHRAVLCHTVVEVVHVGAGNYCLHELRHSYLTQLARAGVHPKVMQELAGHANSAITMDIYTHTDMGAKFEAAEALKQSLA